MSATISLCSLPNFAGIDLDLCTNLKECKYTVPPNSTIQSCCSASSLNIHCSYFNFPASNANSNHTIRPNKDDLLQCKPRKKDEDINFNLKTRLSPSTKICIPKPCQIPKDSLEFITKEIADPLWNSTYCLERIKTIISSPSMEDMGGRILDIWKLYLRLSPQGVFLRDVHEISKIIRYVDINYINLKYAETFLNSVFSHLKKGVRIKGTSENKFADNLRVTLDGFSRALTFGYPQVRTNILQVLISWLDFYTDDSKYQGGAYRPNCEDVRRHSPCSKNEWKTTKEGRIFQEPVTCEEFRDYYVTPEMETKCVANCQVSKPKKTLEKLGTLCKSSFFGAFESSILPSTLEQLCGLQEFDDDYLLKLIIIKKLCENSYCIRSCVVNSSILDVSLLKLGYPDPEQKILCRTLELLYSLLAFDPNDYNGVRIYVAPDKESFELLLYRFMNLLVHSSLKGNMLRNDLALITYLLALECPQLRDVFSKHLRDFASILSNNILTDQPFEVLLDSTPEDLELIQYLIWILDLVIPAEQEHYSIVESYQLIPVMVRLIIGPCALMEEAGIETSSYKSVLRAASKALVTFAKIQPLLFVQPEGVQPMFSTFAIFASKGQVSLDIVEAFLDTTIALLKQCAFGGTAEDVLSYFALKNGMGYLCGVLQKLTSHNNFLISIEPLLCKALYCCSEMGKYDERQKDEFADRKGVNTIIRLIHQILYTQAQVRHMNPSLHIMTAECIWNCIADCPTGLEVFLHYEGVFRLLDLLEIAASPAVQLHLLGVLLELIDYSRCRDQMIFWHRRMKNLTARQAHNYSVPMPPNEYFTKSVLLDDIGHALEDYNQSLASLFCEIWRDAEIRLGVLREDDGTISSLEYPLMSEFARNFKRELVPNHPLPATSSGPASLDLINCLRPRLYLLVKAITEETNTEATVFSGLQLQNQVTMQIMVNFLDLKVSELWIELDKEMQSENLKLVKSDTTAMEILLKISRNKVAAVLNTQKYLIQRWTEQNAMNERQLYLLLRNCQLQDHLMALREAQYYATLSDYFLLVDRKLLQQTEINDLYLRSEDASVVKKKKHESKKSDKQTESEMIDTEKTETLISDPFAFSIDDEEKVPAILPDYNRRIVVTELVSPVDTPVKASNYQVSPEVLFKALLKAEAQMRVWKEKNIDENNTWLIRMKWNPNWYPPTIFDCRS